MIDKYTVQEPNKLKSWNRIAHLEITRWLDDESYRDEICKTTMINEFMGPFTKFLYHFAYMCECDWGVMVDFNERKQQVYLTDHYYKWMHKLRDEIIEFKELNEL